MTSDFDIVHAEQPSNDESDADSGDLFEGDAGTLNPEQRRCLHALLKHRYISADQHPEQWATLLNNEALIKSRLNDVFLELQLDRSAGVAFKRRTFAHTGDPLPSLLRDVAHTKEETIVLLAVRERFYAQRQEGDDAVFVDRQALLDAIAERWPEHLTHRTRATSQAENAVDGLVTSKVLLKTGDPDRYLISPIIEVLLPIPKLRELLTWLMTQNGTDPAAEGDGEELDLIELDLDLENEA